MKSKPASFDKPHRESGTGLTHRAFPNAASTPRVALSPKRKRARGSCLPSRNRGRQGEGGRQGGRGAGARGGVLGACACQAGTDGELTLRIALGAEMWMMTGTHVALNPAPSLQAEQ